MRTVVLGANPELEALIERRRRLGLDGYDEVWEGEYHVAPMARPEHGIVQWELAQATLPLARDAGLVGAGPFNLGEPDDYRVPDGGYFHEPPTSTYVPTAAIVIEVVSPDDETFEKFDFYARSGVEELIVADPAARQITCWRRREAGYEQVARSELLGVTAAELTGSVAWP